MTLSTYHNWQDNQVITSLKNIDKSIIGMDYPAITICANGLHLGNVEEAFFDDFNDWKTQNSERFNSTDEIALIQQFLHETFQIDVDSNINVMNIIDSMRTGDGVSPSDATLSNNNDDTSFNIDASASRMVMQNLMSCAGGEEDSTTSKNYWNSNLL